MRNSQTTPTASLDARAEALFAANPEWRPGDDWKLTFNGESWQWVEHYSGSPMAEYPLKSVVQPFLLSALLPHAIDKWEQQEMIGLTVGPEEKHRTVTLANERRCPRDLESAIRVLEGA